MTFLDFFAGVGGFRKGMEMAGHECVGFCEFDKFAVASYTSMHLITDEQREYLATLDLKTRQKEILKEEYRNGEWYANDIRTVNAGDIPRADCWCFGFPCQDISVAGKQVGFYGNRSSLFFRVMYLLGQQAEEERPSYLFIENVKNLLSVNGGWDFARLLAEMDRNGYDAEWQVLNSKNFGVPQNRERCFIIGHLRGRCTAEVFPVEGAGRANCIYKVNQIGRDKTKKRENPQTYRVYGTDGVSPTLTDMGGGGREPYIIDASYKILEGSVRVYKDQVQTITGRIHKEPLMVGSVCNNNKPNNYAIPVLTPERIKKRQNGRRFKENGDVAFTLTSQDRHGVAVEAKEGIRRGYAIWYQKDQCYIEIRKLTPKECFRLQGWQDDYFQKATFVNSDSQLYKQAGNGVTVSVIRAMANKMKVIRE